MKTTSKAWVQRRRGLDHRINVVFNYLSLFLDIPPYKRLGEDQDQVTQDTHITITLKYFHPSELCGFGARPMDNLEFVFNCYKVNDSKCFFMGQVSGLNKFEIRNELK